MKTNDEEMTTAVPSAIFFYPGISRLGQRKSQVRCQVVWEKTSIDKHPKKRICLSLAQSHLVFQSANQSRNLACLKYLEPF